MADPASDPHVSVLEALGSEGALRSWAVSPRQCSHPLLLGVGSCLAGPEEGGARLGGEELLGAVAPPLSTHPLLLSLADILALKQGDISFL